MKSIKDYIQDKLNECDFATPMNTLGAGNVVNAETAAPEALPQTKRKRKKLKFIK